MNVIGETMTVVKSSDPSKEGVKGIVLLDTAKTLVLETRGRSIRVEKEGSIFQLNGSGRQISGDSIKGRLEDRWGTRSTRAQLA